MEFQGFPKISRLNRGMVITEKIDGTNAQIYITHRSTIDVDKVTIPFMCVEDYIMVAGSRNRWVSQADDNYGFGRWVSENREDLMNLGEGRHFGEWWGQGIQRRYDLKEKRFSLFNTSRWLGAGDKPDCCDVVPLLYVGNFETSKVNEVCEKLRVNGSMAAPKFMRPEGVVVYLSASRSCMKVTLDNDGVPKSMVKGSI